ncbi:alpha/beta fold hydrolase [Propionibacteriaceae bacterium G1746]|uniref:alpha/beta fold hydrolase n=1 Tax=Aestuariimicrobium sp. G57 TaxID=3418485 RepID=UPI003C1F2CC9
MTASLIGAAEATEAVPVRGGLMHVGAWHRAAPGLPVLAVHGITASHQSWARVASHLHDVAVVAPDLRGRGRSRDLPQPGRLDDHADDLVAVLDQFGIERAVLVGHSMGAFVTTRFAQRHGDRLAGALLVDGGWPLPQPAPRADGSLPRADELLGPAIDRLSMTFTDPEQYREFWRQHPAFGPFWDDWLQAYVDYDLMGRPPELHPCSHPDAVRANLLELADAPAHLAALASLPEGTELVRVDLGLLNEPAGLYPRDHAAALVGQLPHLRLTSVEGPNHYTIVLGEPGASLVARATRQALAAAEARLGTPGDHHLVPAAAAAPLEGH